MLRAVSSMRSATASPRAPSTFAVRSMAPLFMCAQHIFQLTICAERT
jgi:hypothetical protein